MFLECWLWSDLRMNFELLHNIIGWLNVGKQRLSEDPSTRYGNSSTFLCNSNNESMSRDDFHSLFLLAFSESWERSKFQSRIMFLEKDLCQIMWKMCIHNVNLWIPKSEISNLILISCTHWMLKAYFTYVNNITNLPEWKFIV